MKKFDYYIGIDISKKTLDISLLYECENRTKTIHYKIENTTKSIANFLKEKIKKIPIEQMLFCFEDTGIYGFPLASCLQENKLIYWKVSAVEIKRSKGICRGKDDKSDSKDIAFYAFTNTHKFRPSSLAETAIEQLKLLFAEREKLLKAVIAFQRTAENKDFLPKKVYDVVEKSNKTIVKQLKTTIEKMEDKMIEIIRENEDINNQYQLVKSVPGVGMQTAIYILIATKGFSAFDNWRQLACYAGVAPFPFQSGTSLSRANKVHPLADKKLKSLLNMCAICAVRHDKELKMYYERKIDEGKSKMLVINNVRAKLLARIFAVVNRGTPFVNTAKFAS